MADIYSGLLLEWSAPSSLALGIAYSFFFCFSHRPDDISYFSFFRLTYLECSCFPKNDKEIAPKGTFRPISARSNEFGRNKTDTGTSTIWLLILHEYECQKSKISFMYQDSHLLFAILFFHILALSSRLNSFAPPIQRMIQRANTFCFLS